MKNNLTLEMIMDRFHDWTINLYTKDDTEIIGKYDKYLNYPVEHAEITDMAGDITVSVYLDKMYDENYEEDFEEGCPYCGSYSAVMKPFSKNKYIGYCKDCGKTIFLCSECMCGEEEVEEDNPNYCVHYDTDGSVLDYSVICNWHSEFDENGDEWSVCFRGKYKTNLKNYLTNR